MFLLAYISMLFAASSGRTCFAWKVKQKTNKQKNLLLDLFSLGFLKIECSIEAKNQWKAHQLLLFIPIL